MIANIARVRKLAVAWMLSLVAAGAIASVLTSLQAAQARPPMAGQPSPGQLTLMTEGTTILSGSDIGFRLERTQDGIPIGTLVVRVDGRWIEARDLSSK